MLATHIRGAPAAAAPVVGLVEAILRPLQRRWSRARSNLIPRRHHGARLERSNGGEESTAPRKWKGVTSILRTLALSIDRKKRVSCPLSLYPYPWLCRVLFGQCSFDIVSSLASSSRRRCSFFFGSTLPLLHPHYKYHHHHLPCYYKRRRSCW